MLIRWSDEDGVYIVTLPEFENAKTHGNTYESAARQGHELIESFVMWYQQDGQTLPAPFVFEYPGEDFAIAGRSPTGVTLETSVG
ncbi:MAG TPA: type II toxin-antitoxin system HicB family antitoxin [Tepidisphaeraceae bacterium]|jgi:predicted RNase H-like HicB family nuclease|nr:type II toxin-antitoxin system HicB family antitoxin [Tepidisphaeraceae bacterium]